MSAKRFETRRYDSMSHKALTLTAVFWLSVPSSSVLAGMPGAQLSDFAMLRFQTISFFAVAFVISAVLIRFMWNRLARGVVSLPQLTIGQSFGATLLWGLLFVIVLTMISGARELMTPGAWERNGSTYRLRAKEAPEPSAPMIAATISNQSADFLLIERYQRLANLGDALSRYASEHGGRFPATLDELSVAPAILEVPQHEGVRYAYRQNLSTGGPAVPLVFEPGVFAEPTLVLTTRGNVVAMPLEQILPTVPGEGTP